MQRYNIEPKEIQKGQGNKRNVVLVVVDRSKQRPELVELFQGERDKYVFGKRERVREENKRESKNKV